MEYNGRNVWGLVTAINLYDCDPELIRDAQAIEKFVIQLCDLIDMKRFGECHIVHFGEGDKEGFSMFQLIETSNISAHFANDSNAVYLDIFSCKEYLPLEAVNFAIDYFKAKRNSFDVIERV